MRQKIREIYTSVCQVEMPTYGAGPSSKTSGGTIRIAAVKTHEKHGTRIYSRHQKERADVHQAASASCVIKMSTRIQYTYRIILFVCNIIIESAAYACICCTNMYECMNYWSNYSLSSSQAAAAPAAAQVIYHPPGTM